MCIFLHKLPDAQLACTAPHPSSWTRGFSKNFKSFSHYKSMETLDPCDRTILNPRD